MYVKNFIFSKNKSSGKHLAMCSIHPTGQVEFCYDLLSGQDCDANNSGDCETVEFKVIFNKQKYDVTFPVDKTVLKLKEHVQTLTGSINSLIMMC